MGEHVEQRVSIITLGVEDLAESTAFYQRLGGTPSNASQEGITFFQAGGAVIGLYGRAALAEDANVADTPATGFRGVTLAYICRSESEVDDVLKEAENAGANIAKYAEKVFWGGYSGYFSGP